MGCMFFSNFSCQPYVINIQLRNTDNICTDLYMLLKPQSELGYLGFTLCIKPVTFRTELQNTCRKRSWQRSILYYKCKVF